ncbi:ATP-binding protein [Candidatus Thiothrix sp. Deng01]|uniref:histidine kinase n=1 Tax=Candidatus Thiothrix phosphatis TaxID=3112415 RepID=A0ABU6CW03_9GAMM|nr:ATP-binding protein [Candidatus Thiothrix sp. Deng01]MEB4590253.1 ATP-binding protein [Candidatus Thiothrix sp. Deng01]
MTVYWRSLFFTSPSIFILLTLVVATGLQGVALYGLKQQPWTGIQTRPDMASGHVRITGITPGSPAARQTDLHVGQQLVTLSTPTQSVELTSDGRDEYLSAPDYATLDQRLAQQTKLWKALTNAEPITLSTQDGRHATLTPQRHTPIGSIPGYVWLLLPLHVLLPLVGALVWLYKPHTLESTFLYLAGISYSFFGAVFCVLYQRELTLNPEWILLLTSLGNGSMFLLGMAVCAILTYYPQRVLGLEALLAYAGLWLGLSLNYHFRWVEAPLHIFIFQFLVLYAAMVLVSYRQWRAARQNPVNRVTLMVLHFSIQVPTGLTILLYAIPTTLGQEPYITPLVAHVFIISMFGGWVAGILRFRLFEAEYWCFKSLMWAFGGSLVIAADILLAGLLHLSGTYALGMALVVAGFVYFPLRQWLLGRFMPADRQSLQAFLPTFSASITQAVTPQAFEASWRETLRERFQPLHLEPVPADADGRIKLGDNGLHLLIPNLPGDQLYRITGKHLGAHLFGKADVAMAESLLAIARMVSAASEARRQAVQAERQRIMHDLHDTVGARLLTLSHELPQPEHKKAARETLQILRETVKLSLKQTPLRLGEHLADWRAETISRAEAAGVSLHWQTDEGLERLEIAPRQALELAHILRELVTNALKHAQPTQLHADFKPDGEGLEMAISHDGATTAPQEWQEGTGLSSLRRRLEIVQGTLECTHQAEQGQLRTTLTLPLQTA